MIFSLSTDLYLGMEFELPIRVAYVLNTVSIAITFVSGIPLMLVFATVSLCLSYLVDRWMLLRYYNKGVIFDDTILRETWNLIPYVAIISLAMSIYMLTEISIFPPIEDQRASTALLMFGMANSTDGDVSWLNARLARSWSFPLFTLMFVSVICLIFKVILSQFISNAVDIDVFRAGRGFMAGCCCTFQFNVVKDKNGKNKDGNNENDDIDDIDDIDDEFNAYYKKMKPAFTELCIKKIDKVGLGKDMISDRELEERWTIVRHRVTQTLYKAKVWKTDGISRVSGIQHRKGEIMRTYDDISLTRLATYNIKGNPRYRAAVRGLHLVAKRREDYIKHHGDTDGLHHATSQKHLGMKNVARGESSRLMKAGRIGEMFSPRTVDAKARELRRRSDMNRHVRIHQARGGAQRKTQHWDRKSEIKYE